MADRELDNPMHAFRAIDRSLRALAIGYGETVIALPDRRAGAVMWAELEKIGPWELRDTIPHPVFEDGIMVATRVQVGPTLYLQWPHGRFS